MTSPIAGVGYRHDLELRRRLLEVAVQDQPNVESNYCKYHDLIRKIQA